MTKAVDVARYILSLIDEESGDLISHLKLQKLLYYSQGFGLARLNRPLFDDKVVAWQHGPVVPTVWSVFNHYGSNPIPKQAGFDPSVISDEMRDVIDDVYLIYGQYSAAKLRNMTHEEAPWIQTPNNEEIGLSVMKIHFQKHAARKPPRKIMISHGRWVAVTRKIVGKVLDIGGAKEPCIYLLTKNAELIIHADEKMLADEETNHLYKNVVATVRAEENLETGELRNLRLNSLDHYSPSTQSDAFREMCNAGTLAWAGTAPALAWVREHRGA